MKRKEKLQIIHQHYPHAVTTTASVDLLFDLLEDKYDLEPHQIMLADSICSDDVNSIEYPQRAYEMLGPFKMGGLDGFPFTGPTGMGAFAGHVPEEGAVFIYYAPHIGVSKEGIAGEIHRIGQSKPSGCCGAAKAALGKLMRDELSEGHVTELDYQMNTLEQILLRQKARVMSAPNPLIAATEVIYEAIDERIQLLVSNTQYSCRYLILMGAILINGDHDMGSFTQIKRFEVVNLETGKRVDHLAEIQA